MGKFTMKTGNAVHTKKMMSIKAKIKAANKIREKEKKKSERIKVDAQGVEHVSKPTHFSELFFKHNQSLGPPYHVICDTNFFYYAKRAKCDIFTEMTRMLLAKCYLYVTDCIIGETEKMGRKYKAMLRSMRDPRIRRLKCQHKGIYADDCICDRVQQHRIFLIATCDRDLKKRLRKIPGVPIVYIQSHRFTVERLPEAYGAPRLF